MAKPSPSSPPMPPPSSPPENKPIRWHLILGVLVIVLVTATTSFVVGYKYHQIQSIYIDAQEKSRIDPDLDEYFAARDYQMHGQCPSYDVYNDEDPAFIKYTVKPNDTLLSIAKNELGDPSKATTIARLNYRIHPSLSFEDPFIEVGWVLLLPPPYVPITEQSYYLNVANGELAYKFTDNKWSMHARTGDYRGILNITDKTAFPITKDFEVGDCLTVFTDSMQTLSIAPQSSNLIKPTNATPSATLEPRL